MTFHKFGVGLMLAALAVMADSTAAFPKAEPQDLSKVLLLDLSASNLSNESEAISILRAEVQRDKSVDQPTYKRHKLKSGLSSLKDARIEYVASAKATLRVYLPNDSCLSKRAFEWELAQVAEGPTEDVSTVFQSKDSDMLKARLKGKFPKELLFVATYSGCITYVEFNQ